MKNMNAYMISTKPPDDKIAYIQHQIGISPTWVPGVDAQNYTRCSLCELHPCIAPFVPKTAIAIALSHLKTWKKFVKDANTNEFAIIFEDDVVLESDFPQQFSIVMSHTPSDFDLLYLGCFGCDTNMKHFTWLLAGSLFGYNGHHRKVNEYIQIPKYAYGAHAYVLTYNGAQRLIEEFENNIHTHVDAQIANMSSRHKLRTYAVNRRLVYQTSTCSPKLGQHHPSLIVTAMKNYFADRGLSYAYFMTVPAWEVLSFPISFMSFCFLTFGIVFAIFRVPLSLLIAFFLAISSKDLITGQVDSELIGNFVLLVTPSLIYTFYMRYSGRYGR